MNNSQLLKVNLILLNGPDEPLPKEVIDSLKPVPELFWGRLRAFLVTVLIILVTITLISSFGLVQESVLKVGQFMDDFRLYHCTTIGIRVFSNALSVDRVGLAISLHV